MSSIENTDGSENADHQNISMNQAAFKQIF